jgi:hypothetical protein
VIKRERGREHTTNHFLRHCSSWVWWQRPVIPAPGRLRPEDLESKASWSYIETPYLKKYQKK